MGECRRYSGKRRTQRRWIKEEIKKNHAWAREVVLTKIKDFAHVVKVEFGTVEAADKAMEKGLLLFYKHVASDQITRDVL